MSIAKHKMRELALQILFMWDCNSQKDDQMAATASADDRAAMEMAAAAWDAREISDQWALRLAPQWPPKRQPAVDRNLLRLAIWELTSGRTPHKVVIDEAIELARQFSTENSPAFINGVLDAVFKEHLSLTQPPVQPTTTPAP